MIEKLYESAVLQQLQNWSTGHLQAFMNKFFFFFPSKSRQRALLNKIDDISKVISVICRCLKTNVWDHFENLLFNYLSTYLSVCLSRLINNKLTDKQQTKPVVCISLPNWLDMTCPCQYHSSSLSCLMGNWVSFLFPVNGLPVSTLWRFFGVFWPPSKVCCWILYINI